MMQNVHVELNVGLSRKNQHSTTRKLFSSKVGLKLSKKLLKCYIGYIALYGAATWTLRRINQVYLGSFKMWRCRSMEKIHWIDRVKKIIPCSEERKNIQHKAG